MPNRLSVFTGESPVVLAAPLNAEFDNVYTVFNAEIDGIQTQIDDIYSGTVIRTGGSFGSATDVELTFGTNSEAHIVFSDANDCLAICLDTTSRRLLICDKGDETTAFGYAAGGHPHVVIHSNTTTANQYLMLYHDATNGVIDTGMGPAIIKSAGTSCSSFHSTGLVMESGTKIQMTDSAVTHGMTDIVPTNVYTDLRISDASFGGLQLFCFTEGDNAMSLYTAVTNDNTTKSTAALGSVIFTALKKSGTTAGSMGANANMVVFRNGGSATHIFDAEGDSHQDGTGWTAYDDYDDLELLSAVSANLSRQDDPIRKQFHEFLFEKKEELQRLKLVTFNSDQHHFVNMSKLTMLLVGAMQQVGNRIQALEQRLLP